MTSGDTSLAPPTRPAFRGHLCLRAECRGGVTHLAAQSFRAPFHISKAYSDPHALIVQVVNPTAGILAGDELESDISVGKGAALLVTTPSATRVFRMLEDGSARSTQRFSVEPEGWLDFWPEPLVPHENARFRQVTTVDLADTAELFFADVLFPGRVARGEAWSWARLCLELDVRIGGQRVLRERFDQSGPQLRALAELSRMPAEASFANLVVVSPRLREDPEWRSAVGALHRPGCWVGVSALRGDKEAWSIRIIASDGWQLRETVGEVRRLLSKALPRLKCSPRKL